MPREIRKFFVMMSVASVTAIIGCGSDNHASDKSTSSTMRPSATAEMSPTQLAAFAARSTYPTQPPQPAPGIAAIVSPGKDAIKIYNFTDKPLDDAKVWVNQSFVARISTIPPLQRVVIRTDRLYDQAGNNFADQRLEVSKVELETRDGFYSVQGPAKE